MTNGMISDEKRNILSQKMIKNVGWTDDELAELTPEHWVFVDKLHKLRNYKVIAEVTHVNDHCELKPKKGDKFVFYGICMLSPEETTFPAICTWALAGITSVSHMMMDRILSDLDPNGIFRNQATCLDTSVRNGGLGNVCFKVYAEKVKK